MSIKITACAPPYCKCPELEVEKNIDDELRVTITDDFGGVVIMKPEEFAYLAIEFLKVCVVDDEDSEECLP